MIRARREPMLRIPSGLSARAAALAGEDAGRARPANVADTLRTALARGLHELERERTERVEQEPTPT